MGVTGAKSYFAGLVLLGFVPICAVGAVPSDAFGNPSALASSPSHIYWGEATGNKIARATVDGTSIDNKFIKGAKTPGDVLIHGKQIYWANDAGCVRGGSCAGTIGVANLNGTAIKQDLLAATTPLGIAISGQYIYWSNYGSNTIGRADLDGTNVNQAFITGASGPDGVVIHKGYIYWSNLGSNSIGRAKLSRKDVDQSFITTGASDPEGMAVDNNYLYWTNYSGASISRSSLDGTQVQPNWIPTGSPSSSSYPTRVTVDSTNIYWTAWTGNPQPSPGVIGVANLDGTDVNPDLIRSKDSPVGVAVG